MDLVLRTADDALLDSLYAHVPLASTPYCPTLLAALCAYLPTAPLPRDSIPRQLVSLYLLTYLGILFLYFAFASFSYYLLFNRRMELHPRFLPNQVRQEIRLSLDSFAPVSLLTLPWFFWDVRGYSKLYGSLEEGPFGGSAPWKAWAYCGASAVAFLLFTDYLIYWVHRTLHHPALYKRIHKPHHRFIIPTPFASHAFHPLDGYFNSIPYHLFTYIFPVHKYLFISLFLLVNLWTIFIHDSDMICDSLLENYINGPSHHTLHHLYFTVNYGQYLTWLDKWHHSFRSPTKGEDPLSAILDAQEALLDAQGPLSTISDAQGSASESGGAQGPASESGDSGSGGSDSGFEEWAMGELVGRRKVE